MRDMSKIARNRLVSLVYLPPKIREQLEMIVMFLKGLLLLVVGIINLSLT
ncbi:hypothetical protein PTE_00391 [Photorhabdus khanii NC19]|uniref:Uncharacterized protein n=1 Tax=Photorhabdus khanii NC19 TaxID=1004151 RepID=W3VBD1_9GAMM|nr:hypothetical protein PTE_00391 [Photorhabdus khanii NC19]